MFNKRNNRDLNIDYIIALVPLLIYGFYKNYIIVYTRGIISLSDVFKQIFIFILTILIAILIPILVNILQNKKWSEKLLKDFTIPLTIIYFLIMPFKCNKLVFLTILAVFICLNSFFKKDKLNFNRLALLQILTLVLLKQFGGISYENAYESAKHLSFTLFDSFFGRSVMNFGTTNIFLVICAFLYLTYRGYYKKEIPLALVFAYLVSGLGINLLLHKEIGVIFSTLITTNILFVSVFVASFPFYSPYTKEGGIIYGILIGILTSIFSHYFNANEVIFVIIFIISLTNSLLDKLILKIRKV